MLKKRIRSSNFTESEEEILVKCILRHATIIENKKTDACMHREKQRAWEEIGKEFNLLCPNVIRQSKALKDKYTNLKTMMRKHFAAEKASRRASGGKEIPEWRPRSEAMAELAKLLSTLTHTQSTSSTFDDDDISHDAILPAAESFSVASDDVDRSVSSIKIQIDEFQHDDVGNNVKNVVMDNIYPLKLSEPSTSKSWTKYTPSVVRHQNSCRLKRVPSAASSSHSDKEDSLQSLKKRLVRKTLRMREIEHQTRLSQQHMEHEARMALLEARKMDFETKVQLRQLKIAKLTNNKQFKIEADFE